MTPTDSHRLLLHGHVFNPERREDGVQLRMGEMAAGREGLAPRGSPNDGDAAAAARHATMNYQ